MHAKQSSILALMGCLVLVTASTAHGQASKQKGFEYADKKKQAPSAVTVIRDEEGRPVKIWKLDTAGRGAGGHPALVPVVESMTLYSNGIMRVNFYVRNTGDRDDGMFVDFDKFYLLDQHGETYEPKARDIAKDVTGRREVTFRAGAKTRFWIEFDAPKQPETKFRAFFTGYSAVGNQAPNEFLPILVTLKEPISAAVAPTEAELKGGADAKAAEKSKEAGAPAGTANRVTLARNAKFEGTSGKTDEDEVRTVLVLSPDPDDEEGVKAEFFPKKSPASKTLLEGWIIPEVDNPAKVQLKLKGTGGTYRLTFDGKTLTGTDSKGVKHNFRPVAK